MERASTRKPAAADAGRANSYKTGLKIEFSACVFVLSTIQHSYRVAVTR